MSVRVTGNLPWSPGGIIEHCSPSVGRGPVEEIPKVRFPPFSKSPTGEISFPCFVFLEPWSPPISCFSSFSRSIACKMCLRYLNDHYSTQVPKYIKILYLFDSCKGSIVKSDIFTSTSPLLLFPQQHGRLAWVASGLEAQPTWERSF